MTLVAVMAIDTKVVKLGTVTTGPGGSFSAADFGAAEFPKVQAEIVRRAIDAAVVAAAMAKEPAAATKRYGVEASGGSEMAVSFTGVVGAEDSGVYDMAVPGVTQVIRVQTGPAIMGTDLRDAPGFIGFGQFKNQIEYQNAAAALNREMKKQVLSTIDTSQLTGKTISVVGAFQMTNPGVWMVTPVKLDVR